MAVPVPDTARHTGFMELAPPADSSISYRYALAAGRAIYTLSDHDTPAKFAVLRGMG
jgi:hypothetical protein